MVPAPFLRRALPKNSFISAIVPSVLLLGIIRSFVLWRSIVEGTKNGTVNLHSAVCLKKDEGYSLAGFGSRGWQEAIIDFQHQCSQTGAIVDRFR